MARRGEAGQLGYGVVGRGLYLRGLGGRYVMAGRDRVGNDLDGRDGVKRRGTMVGCGWADQAGPGTGRMEWCGGVGQTWHGEMGPGPDWHGSEWRCPARYGKAGDDRR